MTDAKKPLTEDELAFRIGHLTFQWNDLHFFVYAMFVRLMNGDYARADTIFFSLRSDRMQRQITDKLAHRVLSLNKDLSDKISTYLREVGKLAGRRNAFIHAMWIGRHKDQPEVFEASSPKLALLDARTEIDDLLSICSTMANAGMELDKLVEKTMNRRLSIERLAKAFEAGLALEEQNQAMDSPRNHLNYLSSTLPSL